jgi:DNA invertase Pin-like site-specific DNA recombinase
LKLIKKKIRYRILEKISGKVNFKDRPKAKELIKIIEQKKVSELHVIELSRLGRNTADVLTLEWLEKRNKCSYQKYRIGNHATGVKNPIAKLLTGILASIYELERQNIMERSTQELPHILPEVVLLDVKKDLQFPTQSLWIN